MGTRSIPARVARSRRRAPPPERHQARRPLLQHQHEHHPQRRHARRLCERPATRGTVRRHLRRTRSILKTGAKVNKYVYCDKDPVSRATAAYRLQQLQLRFPELLPEHACTNAFCTISQDIRAVTPHELQAIAQAGMPIMVMAGTECQDLSAAGSLHGLQGRHSAILYDVVNLIGTLQEAAPTKLMYMVECVAAQHNFASREVRETMHPLMCAMIGNPVTCDAAQLGARAHRLRNYWHNLAPTHATQHVLDLVPRDPARTVGDILDAGRQERPAGNGLSSGQFKCNHPGEPMRAWPTIMSFPNSYRFRDGNQGEVLDVATDTWTAPTVNERERAMGFETDTAAAPGVSQAQRMAMIGRAFDVRAVSRLLAVTNLVNTFQTGSKQHPSTDSATHASYALIHAESMDLHDHSTYDADGAHDTCWKATDHLRDSLQTLLSRSTSRAQEIARHYGRDHDDPLVQLAVTQPPVEPPWRHPRDRSGLGYESTPRAATCGTATPAEPHHGSSSEPTGGGGLQNFIHKQPREPPLEEGYAANPHANTNARSLVAAISSQDTSEPTTDTDMLTVLAGGHLEDPDAHAAAATRGRHYLVENDVLYRLLPNGQKRPVPEVAARADIAKHMHERNGHFGQRRTRAMVQDAFYWPQMRKTCDNAVRMCEACARYRANFDKVNPTLNPLEIKGMLYYRFSADLAKMPRKAKSEHKYVMVVVEHFTKYVCLISLYSKTPEETSAAFALHVIARFGCPAEVLTDNGGEWGTEFAKLLQDNMIDHRTTAPGHPQTNGLSERIVQVTKAALTKACEQAVSLD
ncbi:hypothetical protein CYMTET_5777 [Cymbomonas tetramitiformis]|uniref:Integrase catalytic domain-containing protein n=1 Tax=Cymbomonas tetramitiformis TaxID=36881 RepID=A0AAE0LIJ2_9CHLO|nr:hypothetical protein CYMTET_5777 [Cymbomonas tetramitiformis]